jgi:hypothetical protein
MSEANSELLLILLLLFLKFTGILTKKLPQRIERKRDSIEFERSENQNRAIFHPLINYFRFLNAFRHAESLFYKAFKVDKTTISLS